MSPLFLIRSAEPTCSEILVSLELEAMRSLPARLNGGCGRYDVFALSYSMRKRMEKWRKLLAFIFSSRLAWHWFVVASGPCRWITSRKVFARRFVDLFIEARRLGSRHWFRRAALLAHRLLGTTLSGHREFFSRIADLRT